MSKAYEVFVSYSRDDKDRVRPWVARMREGGVEVFFDTDSLVGGDGWREMIVDAITGSRAVIFVASGTAFSSDFVPKELALAEQAKKKILPVFLEKVQPTKKAAFILADLHRITAYDRPDEEVWAEIERALNEAGVVLRPKEPEAPAADGRKKRKRDDAWLEWDSTNPQIEIEGAAAAGIPPQNERRRKEESREPSEEFDHEIAVAGRQPAVEDRGEGADEVQGRCLEHSVSQPVADSRIPAREADEARWIDPELDDPTEHRRGRTLWLGAAGVLLGAILAGWNFWSGDPRNQELAHEPPRPAPPPAPVPKPKSLRETAVELVTRYYQLPGTGDILGQAALLADPLEDYFGTKGCARADAKKQLADYAKTWPRQKFELLGPVTAVERSDQGRVDCEAHVRFVSENEIVQMAGTFRGRVVVAFEGGPRIAAVTEVAGSRQSSPLVFLPEGQGRRAREFVRQAVVAGNSNPGTPAKIIAEMFADKVGNYYGAAKSRKEIEEETLDHQKRWLSREYRIHGEPVVTGGLGTKNVSVEVEISFLAARGDGKGPNRRPGRVKARYDLEFKNSGTPVIAGVEEMERVPGE